MPDDDKIVEAMARAICEAYRENPDTLCILYTGLEGPLWRNYLLTARAQLAAHRAMVKAEKEQGE